MKYMIVQANVHFMHIAKDLHLTSNNVRNMETVYADLEAVDLNLRRLHPGQVRLVGLGLQRWRGELFGGNCRRALVPVPRIRQTILSVCVPHVPLFQHRQLQARPWDSAFVMQDTLDRTEACVIAVVRENTRAYKEAVPASIVPHFPPL